MVVETYGNIFNAKCSVYAHGVNNRGRIDSGIARDFKERYPQMFKEYQQLCANGELQPGGCYMYTDQNVTIFNLVTQDQLRYATIKHLTESINLMHYYAVQNRIFSICMPCIGCGKGRLTIDDLYTALIPFINSSKNHVAVFKYWFENEFPK